jgi:GTPase SAR1 family protein
MDSGSGALRVGIDLRSHNWIELEDKVRTAHCLIIGATGTGKTTLMLNMIKHSVLRGDPCVIIDPKGEDSTYLEVYEFMKGLNIESRLKRFSMSKPDESYHYNPLKYGNANQLKDRIMEALNWSEQYYQSMAGSYLTALTSATTHLKMTLTLDLISRLLSYKEEQAALLRKLKELFQAGDPHALSLYERVNHFFSQKGDQLGGLHAQIAILNNPTFGHILSTPHPDKEIDLRQMRRGSGVAYFQLDTLGNADSARRLGRMIIEDLKSISSEVYRSEVDEARLFYPIYIDEFGSFASEEFIEFLKQSRGAKFGLHLFCQGLEDLDTISTEFRRQVLSNSLSKIALRVDDSSTVEEFCGSAGTIDSIEQSFQVEGKILKSRTGAGNERLTKQMVIEHDVLKNLMTGEAVFIDKAKGKSHPIRIIPAR